MIYMVLETLGQDFYILGLTIGTLLGFCIGIVVFSVVLSINARRKR